MGYSKEVYEAVNRLLEQRRRKATREAEERKNRIYRQFPRIGEIQREFSSTAIQAARAVLGGQNAAQQLANLKDHNLALQQEVPTRTGIFGADMQVELVNDGPVTIILDTKNR